MPELAELNHTRLFGKRLLLSNTTQPLDSLQALSHFNSVSDYSRLIGINPSNPVPYFGRAIDFMLLQDFDNALVDLDHVVALSPDFMFAYFLRAYVRYKQIDYRLSTTDTESRASYSISSTPGVMTQPSKLSDLGLVREPSNVEYEMVLHDYDMAIALAPDLPITTIIGPMYDAVGRISKRRSPIIRRLSSAIPILPKPIIIEVSSISI